MCTCVVWIRLFWYIHCANNHSDSMRGKMHAISLCTSAPMTINRIWWHLRLAFVCNACAKRHYFRHSNSGTSFYTPTNNFANHVNLNMKKSLPIYCRANVSRWPPHSFYNRKTSGIVSGHTIDWLKWWWQCRAVVDCCSVSCYLAVYVRLLGLLADTSTHPMHACIQSNRSKLIYMSTKVGDNERMKCKNRCLLKWIRIVWTELHSAPTYDCGGDIKLLACHKISVSLSPVR